MNVRIYESNSKAMMFVCFRHLWDLVYTFSAKIKTVNKEFPLDSSHSPWTSKKKSSWMVEERFLDHGSIDIIVRQRFQDDRELFQ